MSTLKKTWWIWALAALGVVAFVVVLSPVQQARGPIAPSEADMRGESPNETVTDERPSAPPSLSVAEVEAEATAPVPDTPVIIAEAAEAVKEDEPEPTPAPAPEIASALVSELPALPGAQEVGDLPLEESAIAIERALPLADAPSPNIIAPAVAGPLLQAEAPPVENPNSGAPMESEAPVLDERQPLTLAQILLPGEAPDPGQTAPSFDLVRVAPDGSAVIAGRAAPGANVQVFSGTIPIAEVVASDRGEFVVFLESITPTTEELQVPIAPEGAELVVSQDDIVVLPAAPDDNSESTIVVRRTPDAVQIVQPSGPAVPTNVSLDMVSYSEVGAVQLAGRGKPETTARVYADGQFAGEAYISSGGNWALEITDIAEGRYVLRVDEVDGEGVVLSRAESPFQREFPTSDLPNSFTQGAKIIVQPGNTLWLMATEAYGEGSAYTQIFSANHDAIRDPDLIFPGQIFSIPRTEDN